MTVPSAVRLGSAGSSFRLKQDRFEQLVEVELVLGRHFDIKNFTTHRFHEHFVLQQLLANLFRVCLVLVDLVDRNDDRNTGRLRMVD